MWLLEQCGMKIDLPTTNRSENNKIQTFFSFFSYTYNFENVIAFYKAKQLLIKREKKYFPCSNLFMYVYMKILCKNKQYTG